MVLLTENGGPPVPRTGFHRISEAPKAPQEIPKIENPWSEYTYAPGQSRSSLLSNAGSYTFEDIQNGYLADSYIHQAVSKYSEKITREGHYLAGQNQQAIEYIKTRLDMMTAATGVYWEMPIMQAIRDYVKFGTGFLIKVRMSKTSNIFGQKKKGMRRTGAAPGSTKAPVGAYFAASVTTLTPIVDSSNKLKTWRQTVGSTTVDFDVEDCLVWAYDKQPGYLFGLSHLVSVLDDVRALRDCEEMIIHLIFKSLNPLIHHSVPDTTGTGLGDQSDVDRAASQHNVSAVNGYIVTPPNHTITAIGMESKALRAEGYLGLLKHRVYAGLGVSDLVMGDATTTSAGATEGFSAVMNDRVRFYQREIADYITYGIIWELLIEGGFNPIIDERDRVYWKFNEVDVDRKIREEAHELLLYQGNLITEDEVRTLQNRPVLADSDRQKLYINTVQIPLAMAGSQSESVSGTGNNSNSSSSSGGGSKKGDKTAPAAKKPSEVFASSLRAAAIKMVTQSAASGTRVTAEQLEVLADSCAASTSALYGDLSPNTITQAKVAVRAAIESTPSQASARDTITRLHGWLSTHIGE
jgi:hypothetical protein